MPRLVGKLGDGAAIVAIGGACVIVGTESINAAGHCETAPADLRMTLVSTAAGEAGFAATDEPMPAGLLSATQIAAILEWEVGFVEGVPGDGERPGLSAAEAELYLRYRPDTGDAYPNNHASPAVGHLFSLDRALEPAPDEPLDAADSGADTEPQLVVQLCASMVYVDDLSGDQIVADAAEDLIDRMSYVATVHEFYPALARTVAARTLPEAAVELADGFGAAEILDFIERLVAELDRRRPWPDPALISVDPAMWPSMGASRPIGWVDIPITDLEWAVKAGFGDVAADDLALLVLRLRSAQLVALVGEEDPNPGRFLVLLPEREDQQDPASVIAYLERYAGLRVESEGLEQALLEVPAS